MILTIKLLCYFLVTILLGAAFAPVLYQAVQWTAHWTPFAALADSDFSRFFDRSVLLSALLLLWPAVRWTGLTRLDQFGLRRNPARWRDLATGFGLAAVTIAVIGSGLVAAGACVLKWHPPLNVLPHLFVSALVIAGLEESFFRGAVLGLLRRSLPPWGALLVCSFLFAVVHFLKPADDVVSAVSWHSGFDLLPTLFFRFADPLLVAGGAFTLFLLGLLLGYATIKTSSLWLSVGLHAGVVFAKMGFNKVTKRSGDLFPWFGADLTIGLGAILILVFLWCAVWFILRVSRPLPSDVAHVA